MDPDRDERRNEGPSRGLIAGLAALAVVSAVVMVALVSAGAFEGDETERAPGLRGDALPEAINESRAPSVSLVDALSGEDFDTRDLRGEPYMLTFLYTSCVDVCPLIGADIRDAIADLGPEGERVTPVVVTVDPGGDTPARVRSWVERLRLPNNTRYLIGGRESLVPVWRDWYLIAQGANTLEARSHNASLWLIDADQRPRARYPGGVPIPVDDLSSDLGTLLAEAEGSRG